MLSVFIADAIVTPMVKASLPTIEKVVRETLQKFLKDLAAETPTIVENSIKDVLPNSLDRLVPDLSAVVQKLLSGRLSDVLQSVLPFKGFPK